MTSLLPYQVIAFYKFVPIDDCETFASTLKARMIELDVMGTVLLASEGINGTISALPESMNEIIQEIHAHNKLNDLKYKTSYAPGHVFNRSKVKVKPSIINLGPDVDPTETVGEYVKPSEWNELISDPETLLIDTRNDYEVYAGTFKGAIDPKIKRFRELPEYIEKHFDPKVHKQVAMFCTGGIRCEKSTAYMLEQGFERVFHLEGGILKYLEEIPAQESMWEGDCYVFDERVGVNHDLEPSDKAKFCPGCGHALTTKLRCAPEYIAGEQCPFCKTL
jgi:UPF0176 protein